MPQRGISRRMRSLSATFQEASIAMGADLLPETLLTSRAGVLYFYHSTAGSIIPFQGSKNAHQSDSGSGRGCGIAYTAHVCGVGQGSDCHLSYRPPCTRTGATRTGQPVTRPRSPSVLPADTDEWSLGSAIRGERCCVWGARTLETAHKSSLTGRIHTMDESGTHAGRTPRTFTHAPFAGGTVRENH